MKGTAHFFLSMACGGLAEQQLDEGNTEACEQLSREVLHYTPDNAMTIGVF